MNHISSKDIMRFAVPVALENLMTQLIGMLIPMLIGGISGSALAAVGMGNTMVNMFASLFAIMSTGGAVLLARAIGAGDQKEASEMAGQSMLLAVLLSVVMAIGFWLGARPTMRLLMPTAEDAMFAEAVVYFRYMMLSLPSLMIHSVSGALLRAGGNAREPLLATIAMNVVLVALSVLMIGGMNMGMDGAGWAYVLARTVGAAILLAMLLRYHGSFRVGWEDMLKPRFEVWRRICRIGVPASLEGTLVQVGYLLGNSMTVGLGTTAATVYQVVNTVYGFAGYPQTICSTILVSFIGQLVGAGQIGEAKKTARRIFYAGVISTVALGGILVLFSGKIYWLYNSDPQIIEQCLRLSWLILAGNIPAVMINATDPGLKAGGDVRFVMVYTIIGVWAIRVPLTWLFCYSMNMGVLGVFLANLISLTARALIGQIRFFSGRWVHKKI